MSAAAVTGQIALNQLTPKGIRNVIALSRISKRVPMIWGPPGTAKSKTAEQVANDNLIAFVDCRLSMYAPTDILGMPYRIEEGGQTVGVAFTPPKILPRNIDIDKVRKIEAVPTVIAFPTQNPKGANGIHYVKNPVITATAVNKVPEFIVQDGVEVKNPEFLTAEIISTAPDRFSVKLVDGLGITRKGKVHFTVVGLAEALVALDELNSAPMATQQAAYQFILDRRINEYEVPEGVDLIAMGNDMTDKGLTYEQALPLANRLVHYGMITDHVEWLEWALKSDIHPLVLAWITENDDELFKFDPATASKGFRTPRSWEATSDELWAYEEALRRGIPIRKQDLVATVVGAIGDAGGSLFNAFRELADDLPKIEDVMSGAITKLEQRDNISVCYLIATTGTQRLRKEHEALVAAGISMKSADTRRAQWFNRFDTLLKFFLNNFLPEITVMALRSLIVIHKVPIGTEARSKVPSLERFSKEHGTLLRASQEADATMPVITKKKAA